MTVAMPTTPANYFHLLRWQALSGRVKPLIVFTPKSMLRLKAATSPVADFTSGSFRPVIGDPHDLDPAAVRQVLLCSGKVYYDLADAAGRGGADRHRDRPGRAAVPAAGRRDGRGAGRYPAPEEVAWVQEEPANMGAWPTMALQAARDPRPPARPGLAAGQLGAGRRLGHRAQGRGPAGWWPGCHRGLSRCTSPTVASRNCENRRGEDEVTLDWLAERLTEFIDLFPEAEAPWTGWPPGSPGWMTTTAADLAAW